MARPNNRGGSNLKPFYLLLGIVVVVGVSLMIFGARKGNSAASVAPVELSPMDTRALMEMARGVSRGPDDAPVQVMVFSDYQCPACAYYATNIEPLLEQEFIATGRIQYIAFDFPLGGSHVHSFLAARAARCAEDQGKFWEYHKLVLAQQGSWAFSRVPPVEQFQGLAAQLGIDAGTFGDCLNSDRHAELVSANYRMGQEAGVNGTPTVFIAGRQSLAATDWDVLRAEILRALGE